MTIKAGLHQQDQIRMKKMMAEGAKAKEIAKLLGCQLKVTQKFFKAFSKDVKPEVKEKEE